MGRHATTIGKHADNGETIWNARKAAGLTQMQVVDLAQVSYRHYVRLENGEHLPSGKLRDRLADVLGVDPSAIRSSDDGGYYPEEQ